MTGIPVGGGRYGASMTLRRSVIIAAAVAFLAGCTGASSGGLVAHPTPGIHTVEPVRVPGTIPVGPGPQSVYTVQPQPPANSCHYGKEGLYPLPDPKCTPGGTNPRVTQANIATTICRSGYTSSIRPPASITGREKAANAKSYGYTGSFRTGEYDHLISLELGGDPNDARNLWVEPNDIPGATSTGNSKDTVENAAKTAVCSGHISLAAAQQGIATDWVKFGRSIGVTLP